MTDQEKIAVYDAIADLIRDRIAIEENSHDNGMAYAGIETIRLNAYSDIVDLIIGHGTLIRLEGGRRLKRASGNDNPRIG
jgi:hypothetical protein